MNKNKFSLIVFALSTRVVINLVGRLMLSELIALGTLPFIKIKRLLKKHQELKTVIKGLVLLLLVQIVSDIANNSAPVDFLRGWAVIIFSIISLIYLVNFLSANPNNIIYYLLSVFIVQLFFGQGELDLSITESDTNYFKTRFVGFLNPLVMLTVYQFYNKNKKLVCALGFIFYGLLCIVFDARSNGLIFIVSGLLLFLKIMNIKFNIKKILFYGVLLSAVLYISYIFYVNQVINHNLGGSNAKTQLSRTQNPYNPLELLMQGRSQFLVLFQAGLDKPLFGHGSWGKDPGDKYATLDAILTNSSYVKSRGYIYAHSVLMGYWAYAGIFGFLLIFYMFFYLFRKSYWIYINNSETKVFPIILVLTIDMLWAFLFSPIGLLRTTFPVFAGIIITSLHHTKTSHQA